MNSILETPESKPPAGGGGVGKILGLVGTGLAVVALGFATYLFVELRDARTQIARLGEQAQGAEKRAKELDLSLAAVRGQTAQIAERAGVTEGELEKTAEVPSICPPAPPGNRPSGASSTAPSPIRRSFCHGGWIRRKAWPSWTNRSAS